MKKTLILAAVAALALSACSKNEIIETINKVPEEVAIGFSNYTPKTLSKANGSYVSGATLVVDSTFAVYAWHTADTTTFLAANASSVAPDFMNPAVVTWKDDKTDGDGNTYTPLRYWPSGDNPNLLSFYAYYPYGANGLPEPNFSADNIGVYAFTAQSTPAKMVDFLVADMVNDQYYGRTNLSPTYKGSVSFTFRHMLTKVQFRFKTTDDIDALTKVNVTEIKLNNVRTTGNLTATYAQNASPAVNAPGKTTTTWDTPATPATYDIFVNGVDISSTNMLKLSTSVSTVTDGDIFLMIPQETVAKGGTNPQNLVITWDVVTYDTAANAGTNDGTTGVVSKTTNVKTLYLDDVVLNTAEDGTGTNVAENDWDKNESIIYTVTIGPKPIWFTGTVGAWADTVYGNVDVN